MTSEQFVIFLVVQVIALATGLATWFGQAWREKRNREWQQADRALATAEIVSVAKAEAEATRIKNESELVTFRLEAQLQAERLRGDALLAARHVEQRTSAEVDRLHTAISQVGHDAKEAWKEANGVNVKIAALNAVAAVAGTATQQAVADTAAIVTDTHKAVLENHTVVLEIQQAQKERLAHGGRRETP
jgi:hypothetical protein